MLEFAQSAIYVRLNIVEFSMFRQITDATTNNFLVRQDLNSLILWFWWFFFYLRNGNYYLEHGKCCFWWHSKFAWEIWENVSLWTKNRLASCLFFFPFDLSFQSKRCASPEQYKKSNAIYDHRKDPLRLKLCRIKSSEHDKT